MFTSVFISTLYSNYLDIEYMPLIIPEPITTLLGGPEMYINKGSTVNLTCIIKHSPEPPPAIYWTHNSQVRRSSCLHT